MDNIVDLNLDLNIRVCRFIKEVYGKDVTVSKWLHSHEDTNILVKESETESSQSCKFVFKVFRGAGVNASKYRQIGLCLRHLCSENFQCSLFVQGKNGEYLQDFASYCRDECWDVGEQSLLITYQPGVELDNSDLLGDAVVQFELGALLGHFHQTLKNMPNQDSLVLDPDDPWFAENVGLLRDTYYLSLLQDDETRPKVKHIIQDIEHSLIKFQGTFQKGILHGDFHGHNLIVDWDLFVSRLQSSLLSPSSKDNEKLNLNVEETNIEKDGTDSLLSILQNPPLFLSQNYLKLILQTYRIIDFNESCVSYYIFEVGRLIADLMVTILYVNKKLKKDTEVSKVISKSGVEEENTHDANKSYVESGEGEYDISIHMLERSQSDGKKNKGWNLHCESNLENSAFYISAAEIKSDISSDLKYSVLQVQPDESFTEYSKGQSSVEKVSIYKEHEIKSETDLTELLKIGGIVLAGYMMTNSLNRDELACLKESILITLLQYHLLGLESLLSSKQAHNREYLEMCVEEAGVLLREISNTETSLLEKLWTQSAQSFYESQ